MPLTWALAIATYNRPEALRRSVLCALEQTRPPCEIIIVDSSPSQPSSQQDIQDLVLQSGANVRVHYLRSPIAQQTIQRNLAIDASSAEVLFMIDDDAYMYPGCAEKVMTVFEADAGKQIAAVGPAPRPTPLPAAARLCGRWAFLYRAGLQRGGPTPYLSCGIGHASSAIRTLTFRRRPCRSAGRG